MKSLRLRINGTGLEYDRCYGIDRRTGWHAVHRGSFVMQFVSFPRALVALIRAIART